MPIRERNVSTVWLSGRPSPKVGNTVRASTPGMQTSARPFDVLHGHEVIADVHRQAVQTAPTHQNAHHTTRLRSLPRNVGHSLLAGRQDHRLGLGHLKLLPDACFHTPVQSRVERIVSIHRCSPTMAYYRQVMLASKSIATGGKCDPAFLTNFPRSWVYALLFDRYPPLRRKVRPDPTVYVLIADIGLSAERRCDMRQPAPFLARPADEAYQRYVKEAKRSDGTLTASRTRQAVSQTDHCG